MSRSSVVGEAPSPSVAEIYTVATVSVYIDEKKIGNVEVSPAAPACAAPGLRNDVQGTLRSPFS